MYACTHVCMLGIKYFLGPRSSPGTPSSWLPFRRPLAWRHNFWSSVLGNVSDWRQLLLNTLKAFKNCGKAWKSMMHDAHDFCLKLFDKISHCMFCMLLGMVWPKMIPIPAKPFHHNLARCEVSHTTELCKHIALPGQISLCFLLNYFNLELPNKLLSMSQWDSCKSQTTNTKRDTLWVKNLFVLIVSFFYITHVYMSHDPMPAVLQR